MIGADSLLTQLHTPLGRITHAAKQTRNLIYLIYTLTRTNESAHVPARDKAPRGNPSPTHPRLKETGMVRITASHSRAH